MTKKPTQRRITLVIDDDLYRRLTALAEAERRELKPQLLVIIERAVKMAEGRKRSQSTRRLLNQVFDR